MPTYSVIHSQHIVGNISQVLPKNKLKTEWVRRCGLGRPHHNLSHHIKGRDRGNFAGKAWENTDFLQSNFAT